MIGICIVLAKSAKINRFASDLKLHREEKSAEHCYSRQWTASIAGVCCTCHACGWPV